MIQVCGLNEYILKEFYDRVVVVFFWGEGYCSLREGYILTTKTESGTIKRGWKFVCVFGCSVVGL